MGSQFSFKLKLCLSWVGTNFSLNKAIFWIKTFNWSEPSFYMNRFQFPFMRNQLFPLGIQVFFRVEITFSLMRSFGPYDFLSWLDSTFSMSESLEDHFCFEWKLIFHSIITPDLFSPWAKFTFALNASLHSW